MSGDQVPNKDDFDVAVVGAGPAGLTAALLMAQSGLSTVLFVGPEDPSGRPDPRTTALMQGAIRLLQRLGVWSELRAHCAPLKRLRLIDDTNWSIKAPTVLFDCDELGEEAFGWNIPNRDLVRLLEASCRGQEYLQIIQQHVHGVDVRRDTVQLKSDGGFDLTAALVVAADGRDSVCRDAAGIKTNAWSYPQSAIACSFSHSEPHDFMSIEFHKSEGPFTLVPLPGNRSSLVWVTTPAEAKTLSALPEDEFQARLAEEAHGLLGTITDVTPRGVFPIKGLTARRFASRRVALIGEAAHVLPPIGAQGLNLGIRDAALIAELVKDAVNSGKVCADPTALEDYDRRRRLDILPRTVLVDFLNRSLFSGVMPLQGLRGLGLFMLDTVGPLRRAVMRQGIEPQANLPRIMQREEV